MKNQHVKYVILLQIVYMFSVVLYMYCTWKLIIFKLHTTHTHIHTYAAV